MIIQSTQVGFVLFIGAILLAAILLPPISGFGDGGILQRLHVRAVRGDLFPAGGFNPRLERKTGVNGPGYKIY
jgi:hypothetical protein